MTRVRVSLHKPLVFVVRSPWVSKLFMAVAFLQLYADVHRFVWLLCFWFFKWIIDCRSNCWRGSWWKVIKEDFRGCCQVWSSLCWRNCDGSTAAHIRLPVVQWLKNFFALQYKTQMHWTVDQAMFIYNYDWIQTDESWYYSQDCGEQFDIVGIKLSLWSLAEADCRALLALCVRCFFWWTNWNSSYLLPTQALGPVTANHYWYKSAWKREKQLVLPSLVEKQFILNSLRIFNSTLLLY